jgi:hypothetical protein
MNAAPNQRKKSQPRPEMKKMFSKPEPDHGKCDVQFGRFKKGQEIKSKRQQGKPGYFLH